MKKMIVSCLLLIVYLLESKAQTKHFFEIGLNSDYFIHKRNYGDINFSNPKSFNASYTHLLKRIAIKVDYSYAAWDADMDYLHYYLTIGRRRYFSTVLNSKRNTVIALGTAYKFNGKFKNTFLYLNLSYSDYKDAYFGIDSSFDEKKGTRKRKGYRNRI